MSLFKPKGKHAQGAKKTKKAKKEEKVSSSDALIAELSDAPAVVMGSKAPEGEHEATPRGASTENAAQVQQAANVSNGPESAVEAAGEGSEAADGGTVSHVDQDSAVTSVIEPIAVNGAPGFVATDFAEIPKKKRRRALKAFGITLGVLAGVVLVAYLAGAIVFMGRFLPNTAIGNHDISLKTDAEVAEILNDIADDYKLDVMGTGFSYHLTGADTGLSVDANEIVRAMHADLNAWQWPVLIIQQEHDETPQLEVSYERARFEPGLLEAVGKFNEEATDPVNATIVYEEKTEKFVVKPEEAGTKLNPSAVLTSVCTSLSDLEPRLKLGDEQLVQPTVRSTDEKLIEAAELASGMVSAKLTLVMDGKNVGEVNGEALSEFVKVDDSFAVTFEEDEMNAWVDELAAGFNTAGSERSYVREDGKIVAVSGGVYGWEVDIEALKNAVVEGIKAGEKAEIEVPCIGEAAVFNGPHERDWGNRYIDVDISEQYVRFYGDNSEIIWESACISGAPDGKHDTLPGVWLVNAKESPSKLIGYENGKKIYETSVKYWMPFEGNGIGFHDATWQPSFGGSMYANGYGSHGCVNLSYDAAQSLYDIIREGDVVVVHS